MMDGEVSSSILNNVARHTNDRFRALFHAALCRRPHRRCGGTGVFSPFLTPRLLRAKPDERQARVERWRPPQRTQLEEHCSTHSARPQLHRAANLPVAAPVGPLASGTTICRAFTPAAPLQPIPGPQARRTKVALRAVHVERHHCRLIPEHYVAGAHVFQREYAQPMVTRADFAYSIHSECKFDSRSAKRCGFVGASNTFPPSVLSASEISFTHKSSSNEQIIVGYIKEKPGAAG